MNQITKFYLTSFLKNQTYFAPVFIILLQSYHLTFQQIFWIFTIGSIFSLIIEIPTGIIADLYGKRKSIILSKLVIFISFIIFGFSTKFWHFVIAQIIYELGNSFRSGTETAYTYDYLHETTGTPSYTEVKGKQKFYARIGEAIASAIGGFIAATISYNAVFFFSAIPAFMNFILGYTWEEIKEKKEKISAKSSLYFAKDAIHALKQKTILKITLNIMIFTSVLAAVQKFIQPYMTDAGISIELFGIVYAASLILAALAVRYSYLIENKFGEIKTINFLSLIACIPLLIIGTGYISYLGIALFFVIVLVENIRSPIANSAFHDLVTSHQRATMGSILSLFKSLGKITILPLAGFLADAYSMYTAVMVFGIILLVNGLLLRFRK